MDKDKKDIKDTNTEENKINNGEHKPKRHKSHHQAYTRSKLHKIIEEKLSGYYGLTCENATLTHFYKAVAILTRDILSEKRRDFRLKSKTKRVKNIYYLCMEFLVGKQLKNNIYNLGIEDELEEILNDYGFGLEDLYEKDVDPGLGNGGLGRLAACFMDSLATQNYYGMGYSIRYEFGLFRQKLVDGWQIEFPDDWLSVGDVFLIPRTDHTVKINFGGYIEENWEDGQLRTEYKDFQTVEAIPYDLMISGYACEGAEVLRLWRAKSPTSININLFSQGDFVKSMEETARVEAISKVLYPADNHYEGKTLRLKQQYFFVSASIQNIIKRHLDIYPNLNNFHRKNAVHINDTHPTFAIPELMRILIDEHGYVWEDAWKIVTDTVAYTNHTILPEALETWPEYLVKTNMPRIYAIICEINRRLCEDLWKKYTGNWDKIQRMSILAFNQIRMANLCIAGGHSINGVAKIHSDLLKNNFFRDFYEDTPKKFTNVTNGIAHRRWLVQSNPLLSELLDGCIGPDYRRDASILEDFKKFENDTGVLRSLSEIKHRNKICLSNYIKKTYGFSLNTDSVFNVQVKRLHEYKRQLLNVLRIISVYNNLLENPEADILPQTYIFAAKAAPSYHMAKQIIKLIYCLGEDIKKQPKIIRDKLSVVFLEDYSVSLAEQIMPASEVSQQISLAGKEASGTGNMKLMVNGAVTIGTLDGANIEISEAVGEDNIFIFGMTAEEVDALWAAKYDPDDYYVRNEKLMKVIASLNGGFNGVSFNHITQYLLAADYIADPFMCLADFKDYCLAHDKLDEAYGDSLRWNKMSLHNIASAGVFAADRSIKEYAENIWDIHSL
ncbi:MAG: glycogen/starch/alpha-glucan phosphorylase [Oscillospiraceae bacterium]|nr:glycogen/starch/alpha-glucan phosphorylase [Oscillospiraceae bacterium]